ncbi:MAG TPA: hypothetical protein VFJ16_05520 [Longimicrobium sp.]|nr:hypothetical protein [Longimicrobium sp.]
MTKRTFFRAALAAAALSLAACGKGNGDGDDAAATQPAGEQVSPDAQQQAGPQTEPNTEQANNAQPAPPGGAPGGRSYDDCMRSAQAAKSEGEREVLARTCHSLPGAPRQ